MPPKKAIQNPTGQKNDLKTRKPKKNGAKTTNEREQVKDSSKTSSDFQQAQNAAWGRATLLPSKATQTDRTKSESKTDTTKKTDWQQVWDSAQPSTSSFQDSQDEAWANATPREEGESSTKKNVQSRPTSTDMGYDAAKPLVDAQGAWMEAMVRLGLGVDAEGKISNQPEPTMDSDEEENEYLGPEQLFRPTLSHQHSRPSSPTISNFSIVFSDRTSKAKGSLSASDSMFLRCKPVAKEEASTALGLGDSWQIVKEEDANEEWEILEGADVEDDWDMVPETEKLRVEDGKKGFNQNMREFYEAEKAKREKEEKRKREKEWRPKL